MDELSLDLKQRINARVKLERENWKAIKRLIGRLNDEIQKDTLEENGAVLIKAMYKRIQEMEGQ